MEIRFGIGDQDDWDLGWDLGLGLASEIGDLGLGLGILIGD